MTKWVWAAFLVAGLGQDERKYATSYLGKAPPELVSEKASWFNTPAPLSSSASSRARSSGSSSASSAAAPAAR